VGTAGADSPFSFEICGGNSFEIKLLLAIEGVMSLMFPEFAVEEAVGNTGGAYSLVVTLVC
jgi:hypothetical protein